MKNVKQKYSEDEVLSLLWKKHDVKIIGTDICILNGTDPKFPKKNDLGNNSWGKIDYLKNYCDYKVINVSKFN